jgi:cytochrome c oxidase assembly factor CtaG/cytochrome c2
VSISKLPLALHVGEPLAPHDLLTGWSWDPGIVIPLALAAWLYWRGASIERGFRRHEMLAFAAGWLTLLIALVSPLHRMGEALFSAHMAQHELIMVVAAPLLVVSRPLIAMLWAIPIAWRRAAGRVAATSSVQAAWGVLTAPLVAWLLHALVLWLWHAPSLYQATLRSDVVHSIQHLSFLVSALLFWWALVRCRAGQLGYGAGVFYVFTTGVHSSILGALLTFSPSLLYPVYSGRTSPWGLAPIEDQQLAGLIMWVPAGTVYLIAGLWMFAAWLRPARQIATAPKSVSYSTATVAGWMAVVAAGSLLLSSCGAGAQKAAAEITGGSPRRGEAAIERYGCRTCHTIPGVPGADGEVGPNLAGIRSRAYVAGMLPNNPANLMKWIQNPKDVNPKTVMPNMQVTPADAKDISAYLYTLQ